jgi:hypothetical protein
MTAGTLLWRAGIRAVAAGCLLVLAAATVDAGWWEVHEADASFDLTGARRQALAVVADDPLGAGAVAAAQWWLDSLDFVPDPGEILTVVEGARDPELEFVLARIEAELTGRPPAGTLIPAELAGPFGVFDTLDLERDAVPADDALPPLETPWTRTWTPYRVLLESRDGTVSIPDAMNAGGVALVAWTISLEGPVAGWMAVEARGNVNLELDDSEVARLRYCGEEDAGVTWYRVRLESGLHRVRAEIGSRPVSRVRISLYDDAGNPVAVAVTAERRGPWAASSAVAEQPPAAAAVAERLDQPDPTVAELLLAAELARGREDASGEREVLERARRTAPDDPWPRLALAKHFLLSPTGVDAETDARRAREELRNCGEIPAAKLAERLLALREQRVEDLERVLDELVEAYGEDARVRQLWVREAVRRGWVGEVEKGIEALRVSLPESESVLALRLDALEALDLWEDRRELLQTVASTDPVRLQWVEELAAGCLAGDAVALLDRLDERVDEPAMDITRLRLLLSAGALDQARAELERARRRWGDLHDLDQLRMVVEADDREALDRALRAALERDPSDLQLRALAWREGLEPFFEPFAMDAAEIEKADAVGDGELDVVLLLDQAVERVYSDGSSIYYYHGISRALTPVGARQASALQQMPDAFLLKVRIIKPDGRVVVPAQMESRNGTLVLGDVMPGDLVEEEYVSAVRPTGSSRRGHMSPYVYRFADEDRAFGYSEYLLLVPPDVDLRIDGNFEGLEREEWVHEGLRAIRWRNRDVPPLRPEPYSPPAQQLLPWVSYSFGVSWQDVGDTMRDRLLLVLRTSPELRRWSEPLLADDDPVVAVRRLVDAVSDEVAPGRRSLTLTATAGVSFARREGNRLAIVAAALLAAGWDVDVVMARPEPLAGDHLEVPTLETFSEPLLRILRAGREIWVDLEEQRRGVDHIRPILQGGDGLVLPLTRPTEPVALLERLPSFPNPELEQRLSVVASLQASGDARIAFEMELEGPEAEQLLAQVKATPTDRVQLVYQQMANNLFPGAVDVAGAIDRAPDRTVLRLDLLLPDACDVMGNRMVCRGLVLSRPLVPSLASLPERRYPLVVQLPITERVELVLDAPPGWSVERPERRLDSEWGSVRERLEVDGQRVRSLLTLEVPARTVTPAEYPQFARFCQAVDELSSRPPVLERR